MKSPAFLISPNTSRKFFAFLIAFIAFVSFHSYAQLPGYGFKKKITIDNTKVSGTADHTDFPIQVSHTDADLKTTGNGGDVTDANGYDIVFTAADGTTLLEL